MLKLLAHYVAVNKNWFETADESKYWGKLFLSEEDWEVPPPPLAITSEKNSDEYRSWVEEERQKLLKEEEKEAVVKIKLSCFNQPDSSSLENHSASSSDATSCCIDENVDRTLWMLAMCAYIMPP